MASPRKRSISGNIEKHSLFSSDLMSQIPEEMESQSKSRPSKSSLSDYPEFWSPEGQIKITEFKIETKKKIKKNLMKKVEYQVKVKE